MIKLIIFDLSNVCFTLEEPLYLKDYAKKHHNSYEELDQFYQPLLEKAEVSEISGEEVWKKVFAHFDLPYEDPRKIAEEMMVYRQEMAETLDLIKKLRKKYKIAYLTNYCKLYWEFAERKFDLSSYFDYGVVSYKIKARKPSLAGFQVVLDHFNVKPEEAVFTDDSAKNLVNAQALGIKTIQFKSINQLKDEFFKLKML